MPSHTFACPNPDCGEEHEYDIEPFVEGRKSGPPDQCFPDEGGTAAPEDDECESCGQDLTDDAHLQKVYDAWAGSQEPDEPEKDID
jgi:hypothetical protein